MSLMKRIRAYHAALAVLALLAFLTGDFGLVHSWLGYGVAAIIVLRLLWALADRKHVGLSRFYPEFAGLRFANALQHPAISKTLILAVAITLLGATATGVAIDGGKAIGMADVTLVAPAHGDDGGRERSRSGGGMAHELLEELHESLSNLFLFAVLLHASYLILFRRPLALFMLFRDVRRR
jgi:cytochrome b